MLTFVLTTVTSMMALKYFKLPYSASIAGSLLFAFLPYHFLREIPHLFLSSYYMIPPMVLVLLWVATDETFLFKQNGGRKKLDLSSSKTAVAILICILVASTYVYYIFFSCFFLVIAGIWGASTQRSKYPLMVAAILLAVLGLFTVINVAPSLIYSYQHGSNPETAMRSPAEAGYYGLKITQLLLPLGSHRIPQLSSIASHYGKIAPLPNEGSETLGMVGSIGFILLVAWLLFRNALVPYLGDAGRVKVIDSLSAFNLFAVLLGTIGGLGSIFSLAVTAQIRCYNRISIYIAFFSLFTVFMLLGIAIRDHARTRLLKSLAIVLVAVIVLVGVLDQTTDSFVPPYEQTRSQYASDDAFIKSIEQKMPAGAMIFQLPYRPFPESPPMYGLQDYQQYIGYLHSYDLRWSYGAMKGRYEDLWQGYASGQTPGDMARTLSLAGFDGIYVDCSGYKDNGKSIRLDNGYLDNRYLYNT